MLRKITTILILSLFIITTALFIGSYQSHKSSKQNNFVGVIGGHIYVDNSSNQMISERDLQILWSALYRGAPGFILEGGKFITRRIEILHASTDKEDDCGYFNINLYTFFNILYKILELRYPCA